MDKALVTFGTGPLKAFRDITLFNHAEYAWRHDYFLVAHDEPKLEPPSWGKLPLLIEVLERTDLAVWLDADCLIVDGSRDIADDLPPGCDLGLVSHVTGEGVIPNCGVMAARPGAIPLFEAALDLYTTYRDHPWWEQAALIHVLNARGSWEGVFQLPNRWNRHPHDQRPVGQPAIEHYTALPDRLASLRKRLANPRLDFRDITGIPWELL